jgi:hypothetical protein
MARHRAALALLAALAAAHAASAARIDGSGAAHDIADAAPPRAPRAARAADAARAAPPPLGAGLEAFSAATRSGRLAEKDIGPLPNYVGTVERRRAAANGGNGVGDVPIVDPPKRVAGYFKLNRTVDAHMCGPGAGRWRRRWIWQRAGRAAEGGKEGRPAGARRRAHLLSTPAARRPDPDAAHLTSASFPPAPKRHQVLLLLRLPLPPRERPRGAVDDGCGGRGAVVWGQRVSIAPGDDSELVRRRAGRFCRARGARGRPGR